MNPFSRAAPNSILGVLGSALGGATDATQLVAPAPQVPPTNPIAAALSGATGPVDVFGDQGQPPSSQPAADLTPYAVDGATRPDSFSGMQPQFQSALGKFISSAPPEIRNQLQIYSGYRSPEKQQELYSQALQKYGSPEEARKWVAPPGNSQHNKGDAADIRFLSPAAKDWAHSNAQAAGLTFPLGNEPWHIEPIGARGSSTRQSPATGPGPTSDRDAISSIESGGDYSAIGPAVNGGNAIGKYQIMSYNVPQWTKSVLGTAMTPEQFRANPQAQDAVFDAKFNEYKSKYGDQGAAQAWIGGEGSVGHSERRDKATGLSVGAYAQRFANAKGGGHGGQSAVDRVLNPSQQLADASGYADAGDSQSSPQGQPQGNVEPGQVASRQTVPDVQVEPATLPETGPARSNAPRVAAEVQSVLQRVMTEDPKATQRRLALAAKVHGQKAPVTNG